MKIVPVADAEGMVLCHDITAIIPGKFKGRAFKKGHIVVKEDIPKLRDLGKEHLYVWEISDDLLHENDAALRIAKAVAGPGIALTEPVEGKVSLKAQARGLLKVDVAALEAINDIEEMLVSTLHSNQMVGPGSTLAGCRVVPLVVDAAKVCRVEEICQKAGPIVQIKPLRSLTVGMVTTGSEVFHGRIKDQFGPVVRKKIEDLGSRVLRQILVPDNTDMIVDAIRTLIQEGAEMVVATGGMSVDPDDLTPGAIRAAGGELVSYGAPVLPGSMFLLAHIGAVPILGAPGCVMYHKTTIFDLILPRLLAGEQVTRKDIVRLGHGGLCLECEECRFPDCAFGKGS